MEKKKKLSTLSFRNGYVRIDSPDDYFDLEDIPFLARSRKAETIEQEIAERLKTKFATMRMPRRQSLTQSCYEIEKLRTEFKEEISKLQNEIDQIKGESSVQNIEKTKMSFLSRIEEVKGIREAYLKSENKAITFSLIVNSLSHSLMKKISEIEILLSREFPALSIEILPFQNNETIQKESRKVLRVR